MRRHLLSKKASILSFSLFLMIIALSPYIVPYDPVQVQMDDRLKTFSKDHLLGTDHMGRDVFSRIMAGLQTTVGTSFLILLISLSIGVPVGLLSGYIGGILDRILMRIVDAFMAFPDYIVAIILSGLLGPGMFNLIFAIVMVKWVGYARLARSTVLNERQKEYILMAKINGVRPMSILRKHMIPHVTGNVMVLATLDMGKVILMIASLSYIGLGAQPPMPEWGAMLNEAKAYFYNAPQLMLIPGISIMIIVLLLNIAGDYLRDHFDVKNH